VADPPQYEAIVLIGYEHANQRYVAHWCDTFGGKFSSVGYGKRDGNKIEFKFDYESGPFYNTFTWNPETNTWTSRGENEVNGKRVLFMTDTARRP
jgi:hypothetical protein